MSYATDVLRRRQEFKEAFQKRYNPAEDVLATLSDIDKELFRREQLKEEAAAKDKLSLAEEERRKAAELRAVERFGLQKTQIIAQTKKAEADRTASDAALAASRQALADERAAREALRRQEQRFAEENRAKDAAAAQAYGVLQQGGLTTADVYQTPAMDKELRRVAEARGAETPSVRVGQVSESLDELAGAANMSREELLTRIQDIELERSELSANLGLTGAKTKKALEDAAAAARRGRGGGVAAEKPKSALDLLKEETAKVNLARSRARLAAETAAAGEGARTQLPKEVRRDLIKERTDAVRRLSAMKTIRDMFDKHPELKNEIGPLSSRIISLKKRIGDRPAAQVESVLRQAFNQYKVATTGLATVRGEEAKLEAIRPNIDDPYETLMGKIDAEDAIVATDVEGLDRMIMENDYRAADPFFGVKTGYQQPSTDVAEPEPAAPAEEEMMSPEDAASFLED
jgi:hypothetical protein